MLFVPCRINEQSIGLLKKSPLHYCSNDTARTAVSQDLSEKTLRKRVTINITTLKN